MSQYGANKVATVVLLDTSCRMNEASADGRTWFERSKAILVRILIKKIFAYETDEVGVTTFDAAGFKKLSPLAVPSWKTWRQADNLQVSSEAGEANWAQGLVEAVDFLEDECAGKRFKSKQVVVLSNSAWSSARAHDNIGRLVDVFNGKGIVTLVVGDDVDEDEDSSSSGKRDLLKFIERLDNGSALSFDQLELDLRFYEKKKKAKRLTKCSLIIGTRIAIPCRWMKVTTEDTRLKFSVPEAAAVVERPSLIGLSSPKKRKTEETEVKLEPERAQVVVATRYAQDESKKTRFGASEVRLSYADLEALKRKTGPPSLSFLGSVKCSKVTRAMLVGPDVYLLVADSSKRSQAQINALTTALLTRNKLGIARRIASRDGKIHLGVLYPVSDELGKALYFLKVPSAQWVNVVPPRPLPAIEEPLLTDLVNELIDKMSIRSQGRELLLRDPNFQLRCSRVELRATGSASDETPPHVAATFAPYPELAAAGESVIDSLLHKYPLPVHVSKEKPQNLTEEQATEVAKIVDIVNNITEADGEVLPNEK